MTPSDVETLLSSYFDGDLDDAELEALDAVLRDDPALAERFEQLLVVEGALRARTAKSEDVDELLRRVMMSVPGDEADEAMTHRVMSSLKSSRRGRSRRHTSGVRRIFARPAAQQINRFVYISVAAAALLISVYLGSSGTTGDGSRSSGSGRGQASSAAGNASRVAASSQTDGDGAWAGDFAGEGETVLDVASTAGAESHEDVMRASSPGESSAYLAGAKATPDAQLAHSPAEKGTNEPIVAADAAHVGYFDFAEHGAEWSRRGGNWSIASAGGELVSGDGLRTKMSRAKFIFDSGSVLWLMPFTTVTFGKETGVFGLSALGGEVYVEAADPDKGFWVETPHGRARDLGTKFGAKIGPAGTQVIVVEGSVEASTDIGTVIVNGDQEVFLARRTSSPGKVLRSSRAKTRYAWAKKIELTQPIALYVFNEGSGNLIKDTASAKPALDLTSCACNGGRLKWINGGLAIDAADVIIQSGSADKIVEACRLTNEFAIAVWLDPSHVMQGRESTIVSLMHPTGCTCIMFGMDGNVDGQRRAGFWARVSPGDGVEVPTLTTPPGSAGRGLTHVVFSRNAEGKARFHVNGGRVPSRVSSATGNSAYALEQAAPAELSKWPQGFPLVVANDPAMGRQWLGAIYTIAIYDRALSDEEVAILVRSGPMGVGAPRK